MKNKTRDFILYLYQTNEQKKKRTGKTAQRNVHACFRRYMCVCKC